ncbi:MAG: GspE/PulE family protein [Planctomycetaceae bacterium]
MASAGLPADSGAMALAWLASAAVWAGSAVWVDRDARRVFGRATPWREVLLGTGLALLFGGVNGGGRIIEPIGLFLGLGGLAYFGLRGVRLGWWTGGRFAVLREVAHVLGAGPEGGGSRGAAAAGADDGPEIVLLRKDGQMYGDDETSVDRETSEAIVTVKEMIAEAVACRATDLHVEPRGGRDIQIRCRVDGLLKPLRSLPAEMGRSMISAIKVLADMDIAERRRPQDGSFAVLAAGRRFDVRVNSGPTGFGEKVALRLLDPAGAVLAAGLGGLGLRRDALQTLRTVIHRSHGMLIVCGPTGSGKTTTVYAALREIDGLVRNVVTIEDPIEYQLDNVSQTAVNPAAELTFAAILRAVLRQDPDVILVGEVRDKETAEIAMQAALTGHFVFTTLHANDAPTTVMRLLDIGIDASLIQSAVTAVLAQRLVRTMCTVCREAYEPTAEERRKYGLPADKVRKLHRAKGCPACSHTGYRGRTGIYELLLIDADVRSLLVGRPSLEHVRRAAARQGMKTLRQAAILKAVEGVTTLDEVDRVIADEAVQGGRP